MAKPLSDDVRIRLIDAMVKGKPTGSALPPRPPSSWCVVRVSRGRAIRALRVVISAQTGSRRMPQKSSD